MTQPDTSALRFYRFAYWSGLVVTVALSMIGSLVLYASVTERHPATLATFAFIGVFAALMLVGGRFVFRYTFTNPFAAHLGVDPETLVARRPAA